MSAGIVDRGPCDKLAWDKRQKGSYTPTHPTVKRTVTQKFTIQTSAAAATSADDDDEGRNFGTFIANKLRNDLPPTRNKVQHKISHNIFAAGQGLFDAACPVFHSVTSIPGFLSRHSFHCCWFRRRISEWSDVSLNCVNWSSVTKSTLLYILFQYSNPSILRAKQCALYNTHFLPVCFPSVPQH